MRYILDVLVIIYIIYYINKNHFKTKNKTELILYNMMLMYIIAVYAVTLMPFRPLRNLIQYRIRFNFHMEPFGDIFNSRGPAIKEAILNIVMFLPFGFLLPLVRKKKTTVLNAIMFSFLFSFIIESLQMLDPNRSSDVTDLITNTLGGLFGYLIYKFLEKIYTKTKRKP